MFKWPASLVLCSKVEECLRQFFGFVLTLCKPENYDSSLYLTENTLLLYHVDKLANAVGANSCCLLQELHRTCDYMNIL
jgi:hypothetical protein